MTALLEVRGLTKRYLGLTAVDDVSLEVEEGAVLGLIGPNGSGKSTIVDCISGFQPANAGRWLLDGHELTGLLRRAEAGAEARGRDLLATVGLSEYAEAPAAILSYGQRKLLAIAASMMARPRLVVLDEPVAGVNPTMIRRIEQVIHKLNGEGVTLVIVEHNVDFIMSLCRRVIVLDAGRKIAEGPPALIRSDPGVLAAYLGQTRAAQLGPGLR